VSTLLPFIGGDIKSTNGISNSLQASEQPPTDPFNKKSKESGMFSLAYRTIFHIVLKKK
jgi:hypothetical protein